MLSSGVTSALHSTRRRVFCSRIIRASSVSNSRRGWTSSSAGRRSSALKRDIALLLLAFLLAGSASVSSSGARYFSSTSATVRAFLGLELSSSFLRRVPHTGIRTFLIFAVTGHGNLQYYHNEIQILSYWNSVGLESEHLFYLLQLYWNLNINYSCFCRLRKHTVLPHWMLWCYIMHSLLESGHWLYLFLKGLETYGIIMLKCCAVMLCAVS